MRHHLLQAVFVLVAAVLPLPDLGRQCFGQEPPPPGGGLLDALRDLVTGGRSPSGPASRPAPEPVDTSTLAGCRKLYMRGDYAQAAKAYEKLLSQRSLRVGAAIGMADALAVRGKYDEAAEALEGVSQDASARADWHLSMAELHAVRGRYTKALARADKAGELKDTWAPAIFMRGYLREILGRKKQAVEVYESMSRTIDREEYRKDAASLVAVGQILDRYSVLTGKKASEQADNILNNYFLVAYRKVDETYWPAKIAAGMLLLEKHRPRTAVREFTEAGEINPKIPDAFTGLAAIALGEWQFEQCLKLTDQALKINPRHADAHLVKAVCLMQWRKFEQVPPIIEKVLKVNPNHLDALSLMAAAQVRLGNQDEADKYSARVRETNPNYAGLPNAIGEWLSAGRQFEEAEKYYRKAMGMAPELAEPLCSLGRLYMQTGQEQKAREIFEKAHRLDDFRADVVNYLRLLEKMDDFAVKGTEHFIIKVDPKYDSVLLEQVAEYMESIHAEVCGDFDYHPAEKTLIEILPTHEQFSVRISGRGWIGTVGACTGRVIALAAPHRERSRLGRHNWANVLRHEYAHTVTLAATRNRIPHWFTEACAVWQQPDKRNYHFVQLLVAATRSGELFPIEELDWGFIRPRRRTDRTLAYAQAEWTMEFIIERKSFQTIRRMLSGFAEGQSQAEVFRNVVGMDEKQFDEAFATWAKEKVREWGFDPDPLPELKSSKAEAKLKPLDAAVQAKYALALYASGSRNRSKAIKAARAALDIDPNSARALGVLALCLRDEEKYDEAIDAARRLEHARTASPLAARVLAECYLEERSWANAIWALELLKQRRPMAPYSYEQLASLYKQLGQPDKELPNLVHLHQHTMQDPQYARRIAEIYRSDGSDEPALSYFKQIVQIDPYEASAYEAMASIHVRAQRYPQAIQAAENVCLLQPKAAKSWNLMAVVRYRAGKASNDREELLRAKSAAQKALEIEPNGRAGEILQYIEAVLEEPVAM